MHGPSLSINHKAAFRGIYSMEFLSFNQHDEFLVRLNPATLPTPNEGSLGDCTVYIPVSRNSSNIAWNASNPFETSS